MITYIIALAILIRLYNIFSFFMIKRRTRGPAKITKGSEAFNYETGEKVALIIHGFTSTPRETRRLANFLQKNNISVSAPLLPGHGTSPERLAVVKYHEWLAHVEGELKKLEKKYKEIYIIGNSFGGNIGILMINSSKKVRGLITLGTPILFPYEKISRYFIIPILRRIKLFQRKKYNAKGVELLMQKRCNSYLSIPLTSVPQFTKVLDLSKKAIPTIKKPLFVVQSEEDTVIKVESARFILDNARSKEKEFFSIKKSYHNILIDRENPTMNKKILDFIKKDRS
jgi:carboxylesterase